jgi:hypothetical protein
MKNKLYEIIDWIVFIPNIPTIFIIGIYIMYSFIKENGMTEFMVASESDVDKKMEEAIILLYPKHFAIFFAVLFYTSLILLLGRN